MTNPLNRAQYRGRKVTSMSDVDLYDDDTDTDDDTDDTISLSKADHDNLRAQARKAKKAEEALATATAAQRELLFVKAGVDTDSPIGKLLLTGYTGELTLEAIKAEAASVGAITVEEPPKGPEITPEEAASTDERSDLALGADADAQQDPDPIATALRVGEEALARGMTEPAAMGQTFRALAADKRNWRELGG